MTTATMTEDLTSGFVTFRIGEREFATALHEVREIVRLEGLAALPGMAPPMAGVIELRGAPLPVMDLRGPDARAADRGDVVVLAGTETQSTGVAVDSVVAVRAAGELVPAENATTAGLPDYVVEVLRDVATAAPILRVDLRRMLDTTP
jgi:chemotaxis signal transduction protein